MRPQLPGYQYPWRSAKCARNLRPNFKVRRAIRNTPCICQWNLNAREHRPKREYCRSPTKRLSHLIADLNNHMKVWVVAMLACSLALLTAGCGGSTGPQVNVRIKGNPLGNPDSLYSPPTIRIKTGTTVTWIERDDSQHTVTPDVSSPGWPAGSSTLTLGKRYSHDFKRAGVYRYHCLYHQNMLGVVDVVSKSN